MNLFLLVYLPFALLKQIFSGKPLHLVERLGFSLPNSRGKQSIWIHAVSVGEVKAAKPLFYALKKREPGTFFLITTTTATGQAEAKRSLQGADAYHLLPFDFSWTMNRWARHLRPKMLLLIESDFWPNLLKAVQEVGGKTAVVSGKLSTRSAKRFQRFSIFSKKLFARLDHLLVQNETHFQRFFPLIAHPNRLQITGNLKFDQQPQPVKEKLSLSCPAVTISCTHFPEEEQLLEALTFLELTLFLAPRHPERFNEIAALLQKKKIPFTRWTEEKREAKVILVDAMGQLPICYSLSRLAIVGGSFISTVGGHNILEPLLYETPVFFGPHMFSQEELAQRVLTAHAGKQLPLPALRPAVETFFQNPREEESLLLAGRTLLKELGGTTQRTLAALF